MEDSTKKLLTTLIEKTEKGEINWNLHARECYHVSLNRFDISILKIEGAYTLEIHRHNSMRALREYRSTTLPSECLIRKLYVCIEKWIRNNDETEEIINSIIKELNS
jgi:hypothetical protein